MGLRSLIAGICLLPLLPLSALSLVGCSKDAQKVAPETRGKRGETCLARNDCDTGLACLNGVCAKNEFNLDVTAKQCERVECKVTSDCCGDRATEAPKKCAGRDQKCDPANRLVPGCVATTCATNTTCNGGTCGMGTCSGLGQSFSACETAADCKRDTCVAGSCSLSFQLCTVATEATDCIYYNSPPTCANRVCDCQNPAYNPADPICSDTDCDDICLLRCQDSLCLEDKSCKTDEECLAGGSKICDNGRCVECAKDEDCDTKNSETCDAGVCHKPCEQNEECALFEQCNKKTGDCEYVGCNDDRECILAASRGQVGTGTGTASSSNSVDDPRLYKCLPSEADPKIMTCKIPCENDGSCGQFEACDQGYCKFVGCSTDEQCRDYLGIANQMTSDTKPYVATAKCVTPGADTSGSDTSAGGASP